MQPYGRKLDPSARCKPQGRPLPVAPLSHMIICPMPAISKDPCEAVKEDSTPLEQHLIVH